MSNYANQKLITGISVDKIKHTQGTQESFMQPFKWDRMLKILFVLTGNEYKLYMYLCKWAGKTQYEFSPVDIANKLDFKEDTARKAFKKFIEYGILSPLNGNNYIFDPYPDKFEQIYNNKIAQKLV